MEFRCRECRGIDRTFYGQHDLDQHIELRHGVKGKYGQIEGPPRKPKASGTDFESVYAVLNWDAALLEDQIEEMRVRKNAIDEVALSIQELGGLDHNGKSKKPKESPAKASNANTATKAAPKKKPVKKSAASAKSAVPFKVGLPPSQGGTAPEGKPFWNKRAGRWTAVTPKEERKAETSKNQKVKTSTSKDVGAQKRTPQRQEPVVDNEYEGMTYEERRREQEGVKESAPDVLANGLVDASGKTVPAGEMHVETPLGWVLENNKSNAAMRWGQNRVSGLSDEELAQRINYELGDKGEMKGPDWLATWKRDKSGVTSITIRMEGVEPVVFVGEALVDKVREVLGVDIPV